MVPSKYRHLVVFYPEQLKKDLDQTTFLLSPICLCLLWRQDGTPIWECQCFVNPSPLKRDVLIVLNRGRNLTVKNATRAVQNAKALAPRTVPRALPTCCCTWMTAAACAVATPQIPPMPRSAVTARTSQVRREEQSAEEGRVLKKLEGANRRGGQKVRRINMATFSLRACYVPYCT